MQSIANHAALSRPFFALALLRFSFPVGFELSLLQREDGLVKLLNLLGDGRPLLQEHVAALVEVPEAEEQPAKKQNQHVVIALRHLNKRRGVLLEKRAAVTKEIEELDQAILALE